MKSALSGSLALAVLLAPAASLPAQTSAVPRGFETARAFILDAMREEGIPSVAVAVSKNGKILWEEGFGWADREKLVAATPNTVYALASISKPITATGLMMLVEQGKVDLDAPINQYLGRSKVSGLAGDAAGATVRRVITHTAGLPLHFQFVYRDGGYVLPGLDESIRRYAILVNPPGEVFQYSNMGFGLLGEVIARQARWEITDYLSPQPRSVEMGLADFMRSRVFLPLGMTRSSIGIAPGLGPFAAVRYDDLDRPIPYYEFDHDGASQVWSSAHDLVRFGMFHLGNHLEDQKPILRDATLALMQRAVVQESESVARGLPWSISDDHGYRRITHGGGMPGVSTTLALYPTEDVAVVVLTTKTNKFTSRIAEELVAAVVPKYETALREERRQPKKPAPTPRFEPAAGLVGRWTGTLETWQKKIPLELNVAESGRVTVRLDHQREATLGSVSVQGARLIGRSSGTIPTPDASRHPHEILFDLRMRGGRLAGQASAHAVTAPDDRVQTSYGHYILTSYVDLVKQSP
jgi:CubicO group peptidase (beta-lactamase class C family)